MLVCGSCQQDFQLSDIVKFIEHKAKCGNKENKRKIPYFLSHRRPREGDNDDEDDDDDEDEESHHEDNTSGSETENQIHFHAPQRNSSQKQSELSKTLVDASANTSNSTSNAQFSFRQTRRHLFLVRLAEPYNFQCSQCGDVYSTGKDRSDSWRATHCDPYLPSLVSHSTLSTSAWCPNVQYMSQWKSFSERADTIDR